MTNITEEKDSNTEGLLIMEESLSKEHYSKIQIMEYNIENLIDLWKLQTVEPPELTELMRVYLYKVVDERSIVRKILDLVLLDMGKFCTYEVYEEQGDELVSLEGETVFKTLKDTYYYPLEYYENIRLNIKDFASWTLLSAAINEHVNKIVEKENSLIQMTLDRIEHTFFVTNIEEQFINAVHFHKSCNKTPVYHAIVSDSFPDSLINKHRELVFLRASDFSFPLEEDTFIFMSVPKQIGQMTFREKEKFNFVKKEASPHSPEVEYIFNSVQSIIIQPSGITVVKVKGAE